MSDDMTKPTYLEMCTECCECKVISKMMNCHIYKDGYPQTPRYICTDCMRKMGMLEGEE